MADPGISEGMLYFLNLALVAGVYGFLGLVLALLWRDLPRFASGAGGPISRSGAPAGAPAGWIEALSGAELPGPVAVEGEVTLGRSPSCTVVVPDPFASLRHARLVPREGGVFLEDLGSTNGTFLGGRRLEGPVRLEEGALFSVGEATFRFRESAP